DRLVAYSWPGNIRQLQNVLCRAADKCRGTQIMPEHLEFGEFTAEGSVPVAPGATEAAAREGLRRAIRWAWQGEQNQVWPLLQEMLERELLLHALAEPGISQVQLAHKLGVARNTLRAWLKQFGLTMPPAGDS